MVSENSSKKESSGDGDLNSLQLIILFLISIILLPITLFAQADFRGRIDLDYARTDFRELLNRQFNQTIELSATDNLFTKNLLTLGYFLERFSATQQDDVIKQRYWANLIGLHYSFTGEYYPRYRLRGTTGPEAQTGTRKRFTLAVTPPELPVVNLSYDRSERMGGEGTGTGEVNIVNVDRLASTNYQYKFMNTRALLRDRRTRSKVEFGQDRRIQDFNAGAGANIPLSRRIRTSVDYDFLFTDDKGGPQTEAETMVNNVTTQTSVRPVSWLQGYVSFLGNYVDRTGEADDQSSLSEIATGINVTPADFLRISGSRDYRRIREENRLSISDFFRTRVVLQGRVRERVEGKATFTRTFVLKSVEGSFPSQGFLFNLNALLYPGVVLNSDLSIIQSENPDRPSGQFQIRRVLDLRMIPTSRITLNTSVQTLSFGEELPWLDTQSYTLEFDVNYQPSSRLNTILTFARKVDNIRNSRKDFIITGTLNYQLRSGTNLSFLYNRRGDGESDEEDGEGTTSFTGAQQGFLVQLSMKLRNRADLNISFDTRELPDNERMEIIGVNFVKWF